MTFADAVRSIPGPIGEACQSGKQALKGEHRDQVRCSNSRRFSGSINLEAAVLAVDGQEQQGNLWDYGLGFRERDGSESAVWVEIHPASTTEVSTVLKKLAWLQRWLHSEARELEALTHQEGRPARFIWLATASGVHIRPGTPQARRLQQAGLALPRQVVELG